jgi:hypothetical protein
MAISIYDLNPIQTPVDSDVLVLDDVSEGTTKHITFGNLRETLLSTEAFQNNAQDLVIAINGYDAGSGSNTLKSTTLWYDGAYRTGQYYLTYDNFLNKPTIPSNLDDLTNSTGFIKLAYSSEEQRDVLQYINNVGGGLTPTDVTTRNVPENDATDANGKLVGPLYYTDDRVETFFDNNFATYYNQFTSTFDDGSVRDSLYGVSAEVFDTNLDGGDFQGEILKLTDADVFESFGPGQTIRIYGADLEDTLIEFTQASLSLSRIGFVPSVASALQEDHQVDFAYRIAEFDLSTGQIAPSGQAYPVTIATPPQLIDNVDNVYEAFNTDNFVRLNILGVREGNGVLVYRKTPSTNDAYRLVAVLGPKDVAQGQWIDYYNFDWVPWSGKNESDNGYPSDVIHFPYVAPLQPKRGWVDVNITEKSDVQAGAIYLTLSDVVFLSGDQNTVSIAHNDTQKIRQAIEFNKSIDRKSVVLNAKTYVSGQLDLPDEFGIIGAPYITKIAKLPWSGGESETSSTKMIKTSKSSGSKNISIVGVDFDGNALNQFMFTDSTDITRNYAIDLGINADGPLLDKVRIRNVVGGGIFTDRPIDLRVTNCEVLNSGTSDRNSYSPLYAYGGQKTTVTSNRFENFGDAVHTENTDKGIVSDNMLNAVGSGLIVYGSKFFISSQNVLIGPAGEFLPTPDTLNSEFDLVNIDLSAKYLAQGDYISDNMKYNEDGQIYDLTQTDGSISEIHYDTYYVEKLANGGEQFWTPTNATPIVIQARTLDRTSGEFGFTIPYASVKDIKDRSGSNSYSSLSENTVNWTALADDINTLADGGSLDPDLQSFLQAAVGGYVRADVNLSGTISETDVDLINDYALGDFSNINDSTKFRIARYIEATLLDEAKSDNPTLDATVLSRYVKYGNPNHQGIIWVASYEHEASAGVPYEVTIPDDDNGLESNASGYYHISVQGIKPYLSVGATVTINGHLGFSLNGVKGTLVRYATRPPAVSSGVSTTTLTIKYSSAVDSLGSSNTGTINIVDKFVLAQGRIL